MTKVDTLTRHIAEHAAGLLGETDPLRRLDSLREMRDFATWLEEETIAGLRSEGWTWAQVGDLLGTTRQAAQQRYGAS